MDEWRLGEESPLSIGESGFRDWVQERYVELLSAVKRSEDVAFRQSERALSPDAILAKLAEVMECDCSAFRIRAHGQAHRPFAAHFLARYGGLSRRETAEYLGVGSGPAVTRQLARYQQLVGKGRRLRKMAASCESALQGETKSRN